jgi:YVTN family beta-propeller protein
LAKSYCLKDKQPVFQEKNLILQVQSFKKMKKVLFFFLLTFICAACDDMKDKHETNIFPENTNESGKLFVLSEGLYHLNNSTLACIDYEKRQMEFNFFGIKNGRGLGDTANDMKRYGNQLWIAVCGSSQVEILDVSTGKSIKKLPLTNENNEPRYPRAITFWGNKAYVCSFDGSVTEIDTANFVMKTDIYCGRNPDGIAAVNGKLYVSNSGGLDFPNYDSTVSVINLSTHRELKRIKVGQNPYKLQADSEGDIYVVSRGNNGTIPAVWQRIDSKTDELLQTFDNLPVGNFVIQNDTAYLYNFDFISNNFWYKSFDCKTERIISDQLITDGTVIERPYSISVHPLNGNIYICDAKNYTTNGDLLCFDKKGKLRYKIQQIGLNPNNVVIVP